MLTDFKGADHVYIACGYMDLRRGIDGLASLVEQQFQLDPFSNTLFLFCGRRRDRIKGLYWEGNGFILLYNWLESGSFQWPRNGTGGKYTAVPVADGGTEHGAAKGSPACRMAQHEIKGSKLQKNLYFSGGIWYNKAMRNDKEKVTGSEETVTISRVEYEEF